MMPITLEDSNLFHLMFSWESGTKIVKSSDNQIFHRKLIYFSVTPLQDENLKIVYIWNEKKEYSIRPLWLKVFT